jgi:putative hydrolase of the HAD superfamily
LIIFDLDDTLIDTSGCVTPFKLRRALAAMLGSEPSAALLQDLFQLNEELSRSSQAVEEMAKRLGLSGEAAKRGLFELTALLPADFEVICTPGALEILQELKTRAPIALVTVGQPSFQHDKLKKAGIEGSLFSKIAIPVDSVKKPFYKDLAEEFSVAPANVWVCGDRMSVDLLPAYELQFNTVHMRWGRGRKMATEPWIDHSISDLTELRKIIR